MAAAATPSDVAGGAGGAGGARGGLGAQGGLLVVLREHLGRDGAHLVRG